jgi:hypothetical protein
MLTVHNAEIHTATVKIQTLTVSGKQVTLAVFRQLQQSDLLTLNDGTFQGLPWGMVNYCPGDCTFRLSPIKEAHEHFIWQEGFELRRCAIPTHEALNNKLISWETFAELVSLPQLFIAV